MPQGRVWGRGNGGQGWSGRSQTEHSRLLRESAKSLGAQRAWKEVPCDRRVIENIAEVMGTRAMKLWRPMLSQSGRRKHHSETFHRSPAPPPPTGQSQTPSLPAASLQKRALPPLCVLSRADKALTQPASFPLSGHQFLPPNSLTSQSILDAPDQGEPIHPPISPQVLRQH